LFERRLRRRHLDESQRAMVAAKLATLKRGDNQHTEGLPIGRASELLNVGERSIARAREVLDEGAPELQQAVERNAVSISAAACGQRCHALAPEEPVNHRRPRVGRMFNTQNCHWRQVDDEWHLTAPNDRVVARVLPDDRWPKMYRVVLPNGFVSDLVNLTRAKDAALSLAAKMSTHSPPEAPPIAQNGNAAVG
jgi:hypothetical protein